MLQTLVRLFVILLALAVSPLHASNVLHNGAPARGAILAEALATLPEPLTEEAFFEAVNAAGAGIYSVGAAQGTQAMLVSISITVPGNPPLTASDADAPLAGTPPTSAVDSFFDDPSPTLVWGYDQEPNVLAGSDRPEVQTEIVELDLRSVDPMVSVDPAWYPFTIDSAPNVTTAALDPVETEIVRLDLSDGLTLTDDAVGIGLFDLGGPLSLCGSDPGAQLCSQVGGIITSAVDLLNDCAGVRSEVCTEIVSLDLVGTPEAHVIIVDGFNDAPGPYTLQITENALGLCTSDDPFAAPPPECGGLLDLGRSLVGFNDACNGNDSPLCDLNRPGDFSVDSFFDIFFDITSDPTTSSGAAPRSVTVTPGTDPGHFTLAETAPGSGSFRITEAVYYVFSATDAHQLGSIFAELPAGSVLIADGYRIRPAPGGRFLFRNDEGRVYTVTTMPPNPPPDWYPSLIELTPDSSDPNKTVLTGEDGTRVTIPAPGVELIDINVDPGAIAVTADEITATTESAAGGLVALITASGGSTGEVFDLRFFNALNSGKLAIIEGDAIFEPLTDTEATASRNAVAGLMGGVNSVANGPGTAYCVEQDKAVPTTGQIFRFANSAKQRELAFASQVLDAAREVEAAGLLNPDSDATAYTHSIRQWSIWTVEKGFNEASFTESFVEHTRQVLEQNGTQWTGEVEDAVRGLAPNRFRDIRRVVERAGLTVGADDEAPLAAGERRKPRRPLVVRRRGA